MGTNPDVLIAGAGPSGLMMACQLALRHIPFRIIDKNDQSTSYSGALIMHSRSIEIFHQMGIARKAIQNGIIANLITIIFNGDKTFDLPVKNIGLGLTKFPSLLLLEQSNTEKLLSEFINGYGYSVEWKSELKQFREDVDGITVILNSPRGKDEIIKTRYLIAADGGHSHIREQLHIPFPGTTHPVSLFVTDCKADVDFKPGQICFSFSDSTTSGFFPLKDGRWRIDGAIPAEMDSKETLTFDDIEKEFAKRVKMKVKMFQPEWFSVFHSHQGYALSYQQGNCFLVGDAAHIHSPVGAQGMNIGMQDAYNLAWKLAMVIQNKAKPVLLLTYSSERTSVAKKVLNSTDMAFTLATSRNFFFRVFRVHVMPYLLQFILPYLEKHKAIRQFFFKKISEIGTQYRNSPLSQLASLGNFPSPAPKPGDRLPYLFYRKEGEELNIHEKVRTPCFHLFVFKKDNSFDEIIKVAENYSGILDVITFSYAPGTENLFKQLGIRESGCYIVRPDLYIAYRSCKPEPRHFQSYLDRICERLQ